MISMVANNNRGTVSAICPTKKAIGRTSTQRSQLGKRLSLGGVSNFKDGISIALDMTKTIAL